MESEPRPSRRRFAKSLALAAVAPLALGQEAAGADKPKAPPFQEAAEALMQMVQARYGKFLTAEQLKAVGQSVLHIQYAATALRSVKLSNSDEPAFAFRADLP